MSNSEPKVRVKGRIELRAREATATHVEDCRIDVVVRGFEAIKVDEPSYAGGTDTAPTPLELLTSGLAACQTVTVHKIAEAMRFELSGLKVNVEADVGYTGSTKGMSEVPRFQAARMQVTFSTSESEQRIERLKELVEERCPASNLFADANIPPTVKWLIEQSKAA